jgi:hypothetical protein
MTALDDSLLSMEKLDRTSPELWPEQSMVLQVKLIESARMSCVFHVFNCVFVAVPGVSEFVSLHSSTPNTSPQPWTKGLDPDDINLLHRKSFHISQSNVTVYRLETGYPDRFLWFFNVYRLMLG